MEVKLQLFFRRLWRSERQPIRPTNRPTDRPFYMEVSLSITFYYISNFLSVLIFSMDMQQFESFRRVDVYAFALVMWETTTRFSLIGHNSLSREECVVQSCHNAKRQFWLDSIKLVYYSLPWRLNQSVLPRSIDGGHMTIDVWQTFFFGISLMWASGVNDWISNFFALLIGWFDIKKVIRFF